MASVTLSRDPFQKITAEPTFGSAAGPRMLRKRQCLTIQFEPPWTSTPCVYQPREVSAYSSTQYSTVESLTAGTPPVTLAFTNCSPASKRRQL